MKLTRKYEEKRGPPHQNLCDMWQALYLEKEVGEGMGRGEIL